MIDLKLLEEIVNDVKFTTSTDEKVYTSSRVVCVLKELGAEVLTNAPQIGGSWVTEVKVGDVIFINASLKKLFE